MDVAYRWENADASDASFKLEQRLEILKALVHHKNMTLASLNAPLDAMRGITPLGLAAWLNIPDIVRILLHECPGLIAVNGMDASGATPLMCKTDTFMGIRDAKLTIRIDAARDGRIEVVHDLVRDMRGISGA